MTGVRIPPNHIITYSITGYKPNTGCYYSDTNEDCHCYDGDIRGFIIITE